VSLRCIDDNSCRLIWFYAQLATIGPVVKSTTIPTILNKEVGTVVPKVCIPQTSDRPGNLIDHIYALSRSSRRGRS
jgi:hypothetical protein